MYCACALCLTPAKGKMAEIETGLQLRKENSKEEKRRMRNERKKRKRKQWSNAMERKKKGVEEGLKKQCLHNHSMAFTFWERWRHELQQRKEHLHCQTSGSSSERECGIHCIDQKLLLDPPTQLDTTEPQWLGRGSFGVVKRQIYRGLDVAVKEYLPRTLACDVLEEAKTLNQLSHPNLPHLVGVSLTCKPLRMVTLFYGIDGKCITFQHAFRDPSFSINAEEWIGLCCDIADALCYLHSRKILHNDLKGNNALITDTLRSVSGYSAILIDLGKSCSIHKGRKYKLTESERSSFRFRCSHVAPELVSGLICQCPETDTFSFGQLCKQVVGLNVFKSSVKKLKFYNVAQQCVQDYRQRPTLAFILKALKEL